MKKVLGENKKENKGLQDEERTMRGQMFTIWKETLYREQDKKKADGNKEWWIEDKENRGLQDDERTTWEQRFTR